MSQEQTHESQKSQPISGEPLAAKPENAILDQTLDTVPMERQDDSPADATLQDYTDKHVESVTGTDQSELSDCDTEDSVEELLHEAEAETTEPSTEPTEEIALVEETTSETHPTDEIALVEDQGPPAPVTTSVPDDVLSIQTTVDSVVEAVLFACDEPVTLAKLAGIVECTSKQIRDSISVLNDQYKKNNRAFRIEQIAGGLQMLTLPYYDHWLRKMIKVRADNKLTPSALETLAIVAYKQPAIRADIEAIRGVASGEMLRGLMVKGLVKMVGRAEVVGRPMQYGTTKKFLECFGLNTLKDLPEIEELQRPKEEPVEDSD